MGEEHRDAIDAERIAREVAAEGVIPAAVVNALLDKGISVVKAWREYRGMTQAELAKASGLSQSYVVKIEAGRVYGRPATRKALAAALGAPVWSLDDEDAGG